MQSRMDKYKIDSSPIKTRAQKNQALYEEVKNSALKEFDINSNSTVLKENAQNINVSNLREMLSDRDDDEPRKGLDFSNYIEPDVPSEYANTREYDLTAILEKAKQGKNVDYNKERLKKVRSTQYEILNNLDLNNKEVVEEDYLKKKQKEEEDLKNLINTITELELKNKMSYTKTKATSADLELLSDLADDTEEFDRTDDTSLDTESLINNITETELTEQTKFALLKEQLKEQEEGTSESTENDQKETQEDEEKEEKLYKTNGFSDFSDISKRDGNTIIIKIIIFMIVLGLIFGIVFILNNILNLGLFK